MAIKAKIKARALGPLYMDLWLSFLASKRDLRIVYEHKKFHSFWWSISWSNCYWADFWGEGRPIFWHFFAFRPSIFKVNANSFGIFFLVMVMVVYIHN